MAEQLQVDLSGLTFAEHERTFRTLPTPFRMLLVGVSGTGKTHYALRLIENIRRMAEPAGHFRKIRIFSSVTDPQHMACIARMGDDIVEMVQETPLTAVQQIIEQGLRTGPELWVGRFLICAIVT